MLNKEEMHSILGEIWNMFNNVRKDQSDNGWARLVATANDIVKNHPEKVFEKIVLAVVKEAEDESKIKDRKERVQTYRNAAKAFTSAWSLYEDLSKCLDINSLHAYFNSNPGEFASKIGTALYEYACNVHITPGSFMSEAYTFYEEFCDGISKENIQNAYIKAEDIIKNHPAYMLHMMEMIRELKNVDIDNKQNIYLA